MKAGVPVALATDDEGVSRSDMTHEYLRGVEDQNLSYTDLKRMARTSLEHAFVSGGSLWSDGKSFAPVKECYGAIQHGAAPSPACQKFLDSSEKARLQLKLEQQFREFEGRNGRLQLKALGQQRTDLSQLARSPSDSYRTMALGPNSDST